DIPPISKVRWPRHMRTIADCDDAYYRYAPGDRSSLQKAVALAKGGARFWQTRLALKKYDEVFFSSPRDQRLFPVRSSTIVPTVVPTVSDPPPVPDGAPDTALIVGTMAYLPNRQGVDWFLENCWPAIAAQCPGLKLRIVGGAPPALRERWGRAVRTEAAGF